MFREIKQPMPNPSQNELVVKALLADKRMLRKALIGAYSMEELEILCADIEQHLTNGGVSLSVRLELAGKRANLEGKALDIIEYLDRHGHLQYLPLTMLQDRPHKVRDIVLEIQAGSQQGLAFKEAPPTYHHQRESLPDLQLDLPEAVPDRYEVEVPSTPNILSSPLRIIIMCWNCHNVVQANWRYCIFCRAPLARPKYCSQCGCDLLIASNLPGGCPRCGS